MPQFLPKGKVCIAVTAHNRSAHTRRTIDTICKYAGCDFTLCVVDNASTDDTWEVLTELLDQGKINFAYRFTKNMGPAVATNYIWSQFDASSYLRLDNDIFFSKEGWLRTMCEMIEKHKDVSALSYPIFYTPAHYKIIRTEFGEELLDRADRNGSHPGGLFMMDNRSFKETGGWNEDYGSYGAEDGDYSLRLDLLDKKRLYINCFDWGTHDDFTAEDNDAYIKAKHLRQKSHTQYGGLFQINTLMYHYKLRCLKVGRKYIPSSDGHEVSFKLNSDYTNRITKIQSEIRKALRKTDELNITIDRINKKILTQLVKLVNPESTIDCLDDTY